MRFLFVLICLAPLGAARAVPANPKEKTHLVKAAELISAIREADKIVVYDSRFAIYGDEVPSHIYSSENPQDISELRESIAIEPPNGWFRCACIPPVDIILSRRGRQIGVISVQENLTIGFSHWSGDARIADQEKFLHWFDVRGITGPRRGIDRISAEENADRVASDRWIRAMPLNLRPLWPKVVQDQHWWADPSAAPSIGADVLKQELIKEFPDVGTRIRALFAWFGSGAGPWSGFPGYEEVAARLLLEFQPDELIHALEGTPLADSEMDGAARFFAGYSYGALFRPKDDKSLITLIPSQLKKTLLDHVLKSGNQDNINRARAAFDSTR